MNNLPHNITKLQSSIHPWIAACIWGLSLTRRTQSSSSNACITDRTRSPSVLRFPITHEEHPKILKLLRLGQQRHLPSSEGASLCFTAENHGVRLGGANCVIWSTLYMAASSHSAYWGSCHLQRCINVWEYCKHDKRQWATLVKSNTHWEYVRLSVGMWTQPSLWSCMEQKVCSNELKVRQLVRTSFSAHHYNLSQGALQNPDNWTTLLSAF